MPRKIVCSNCGKRYLVEDDAVGKQIKCKVCETVFVIPEIPEDILALLNESDDEAPNAKSPVKKKAKKKARRPPEK